MNSHDHFSVPHATRDSHEENRLSESSGSREPSIFSAVSVVDNAATPASVVTDDAERDGNKVTPVTASPVVVPRLEDGVICAPEEMRYLPVAICSREKNPNMCAMTRYLIDAISQYRAKGAVSSASPQ